MGAPTVDVQTNARSFVEPTVSRTFCLSGETLPGDQSNKEPKVSSFSHTQCHEESDRRYLFRRASKLRSVIQCLGVHADCFRFARKGLEVTREATQVNPHSCDTVHRRSCHLQIQRHKRETALKPGPARLFFSNGTTCPQRLVPSYASLALPHSTMAESKSKSAKPSRSRRKP